MRLFGERPIFKSSRRGLHGTILPTLPQSRTKLVCTPRCVSFKIFVNKPPQDRPNSVYFERFVQKNSSREGIPCTNEIWSCRPSKQGFYVRCSSVQKNLFPSRIVGTLVSINPAFDLLQGEAYRKTGLKAGSLVHFGSVHGFLQIEGRPICRKCVQRGGKT